MSPLTPAAHRASSRLARPRRRGCLWLVAPLVALLLLAAYARWIEPFWLRGRIVILPVADLPPELDGYRLALLSDIHQRPGESAAQARRAVRLANRLAPDVVLLGGDYVYGSAAAMRTLTPALAGLRAPDGAWAVLGNHDHWTDVVAVADGLRAAGVGVLANQAAPLAGGRLWVVGIDDAWADSADPASALASAPPGAPLVALWHEPDLVADVQQAAAQAGRWVVLQLAGHSHGGQVRLPFKGALLLPRLGARYDRGLYDLGGLWLYTTPGVGTTDPEVRLGCRPEVTLIVLRRAE